MKYWRRRSHVAYIFISSHHRGDGAGTKNLNSRVFLPLCDPGKCTKHKQKGCKPTPEQTGLRNEGPNHARAHTLGMRTYMLPCRTVTQNLYSSDNFVWRNPYRSPLNNNSESVGFVSR